MHEHKSDLPAQAATRIDHTLDQLIEIYTEQEELDSAETYRRLRDENEK